MNARTTLGQAASAAWQARTPRERRLLALGVVVLMVGLLWRTLLAPAWQLWREAPLRQATLEAQTRHMLRMQAEVQQLQTPRRLERTQAVQWLHDSAARQLGPGAQLSPQGEELRVSLRAVPAQALAEWLAQAREQAQALPRQAQLQRQDPATTSQVAHHPEPPASGGPTWSGTLVLRLP